MLKGKKKALAAQVLLGLMVAGNVYTVDCGVASAAEYTVEGIGCPASGCGDSDKGKFDITGNYAGVRHYDIQGGTVLMGGASGKFLTNVSEIKGNTIDIKCGGWNFNVISGSDVTGNVINFGSEYQPDIYVHRFGNVKVFADDNVSGNIVNLEKVAIIDAGGIDAGKGNIMNIKRLVQVESGSDCTFKAGTINMNTSYTASNTLVLDASAAGANGVININADNVTAKKIDASSSGTVNVFGSNAKSDDITAKTLTINGNGSLTTDDLAGVGNVVIDASASENALTLTSASVDGSKVSLSNAVDANSSALFVKTAGLNISGGNVRLNKTITGTREQTKSLVETQMASMALANGSADLVAGAGYTNAAQAVKEAKESGNAASAMVPYAAANYGSMRQQSGSYVDVDSANFNIGFAKEVKNSNGTLLFGPMVEYGRGNYESHLDDGTVGTGNGQSFGVGVMARQTNDNGFYYEGSLRYGKSTSTYSSNNLVAGKTISYDNSANYWGAHAGVGKVVKLSGDNSIDMYGKLFYTRQGASSVNVDGDTLDFSAVSSKRSRIGFRYIHGTSQVRSIYAGLAWQHEFDGSAHATANGFSTPSPSVKGSSGMLELGVLIAPKASPVSFDLGVSGWAGKQKGYSLNANMCWSF